MLMFSQFSIFNRHSLKWITRSSYTMTLSLLVLFVLSFTLAEGVVVQTQYGQLRGIREQYGNKYIDKFFGIPFALPPIGNRRFQKPIGVQPWTGVRDATRFGSVCPPGGPRQLHVLNLTTNEDCLYLNVYAPEISARNTSLPVMVYIHGGGFKTGMAAEYNCTQLALKDVVMVTLDYRVGPLGFLSTGDAVAPGNYGMLDQVMALQWVRDCISAFGGNPNRVTIFGKSAGSASVSLHLISPLSKGLFQGAIMESGVSLAAWAYTVEHNALSFAPKAGCYQTNTTQLVECLRQKTVDELYRAARGMRWSPVVERLYSFLPDTPRTLIDKGLSADVPVIRGINKDELSMTVAKTLRFHSASISIFDTWIHKTVIQYFHRNTDQIEEAIKRVYVSPLTPTDPDAIRSSMVKYASDFAFIAPTVLETQLQANQTRKSPVYLYEFAYRSPNSNLPLWEGVPHGKRPWAYVSGMVLHPDALAKLTWPWSWTDGDKVVSRDMMTMWTNFARYGNPTPSAVDGITWQPFTTQSQAYLYINRPARVQFDIRPQEMDLWNNVIPKIANESTSVGSDLFGR